MLLKNHLIEVFKKASSENNILLKENIILKWAHRFGIDSLNDLLMHSPAQTEYQHKEGNQEQITLMDEVDEEGNQEQITSMDEVDEEGNQEQTKCESNVVESFSSPEIFSKIQNSNNINQLTNKQKLPLPNIKNLRKWINKDKKAS